MNVKELRIGNLVSSLNNEVSEIEEIGFCETRESKKDYYLRFKDSHSWYFLNNKQLELIKPIPLTEEWFLKFGSYRIEHLLYDRFMLIWKPNYNYWYVVDKESLSYLTKVSYVHEWQNFVFIMNGQELKQNMKRNSKI